MLCEQVVVDGDIQVAADGVEAVVSLPWTVEIENSPTLVLSIPQGPSQHGLEVDATAAKVVIDARHFVLLRGGRLLVAAVTSRRCP